MPGLAIDSSAKGTSLSTTTARFIGTFSGCEAEPCITAGLRRHRRQAPCVARASPSTPPPRVFACSCDLPFRSRLGPGLCVPDLMPKMTGVGVFLQESNGWRLFLMWITCNSPQRIGEKQGARPQMRWPRPACLHGFSWCRGSGFRPHRALAGLDGADLLGLRLRRRPAASAMPSKRVACRPRPAARRSSSPLPTSDSASRPVACACARRATCSGVAATVTVRAMVAGRSCRRWPSGPRR